ncbi:MAG TPA: NAD(P)/FAD-dependent oxidoreductase [Vicinamibacterales bacterium]|nr:NAD(P)/FAD-dependent oxidoreductase [Vicinamibacterales bacterium]
MTDCDVLVVGAGPAGTIAARQLAVAGVRVRIVDRATFPRDKLCGDTLNPGSLAMLSRLDSAVAIRVRARAVATTGITVTGPGGAMVSADYPDDLSGASLMRRDFDQWLLESAVHAGARFDPGVVVHAPVVVDDSHGPADGLRQGSGGQEAGHGGGSSRVIGVRAQCGRREYDFRSRVVIAADGRASRLAAALGLSRFTKSPRRWAYGAYFTGVDGLTTRGEMHIRSDGYVGVAPLPGDVANVCVVRARPNLIPGQSAETLLSRSIAADPALAGRFARARRVADIAVLGPLAVESRTAGCPGLLLAGDAAGFVDPMTGDGLRFAIRGGELAACAALAELDSGVPAFGQLHQWRAREFGGKWRINRLLRALVGSPHALSCAALTTRAWAGPVERLVGIAGDVDLARRST